MARNQIAHQSNLRKGRFSASGRAYSVTKCAKPGITLTQDSLVAGALIDIFFWMDVHERISLGAFVVMPDHYHLVFKLKENGLADVMKSVGSYSAREIKESVDVQGSIWQKGYWDRGIRTEEDVREIFNYIHNNPVRKGLVERPEEWPFSSLNSAYYERIKWDLFL
jgi:putative transposase